VAVELTAFIDLVIDRIRKLVMPVTDILISDMVTDRNGGYVVMCEELYRLGMPDFGILGWFQFEAVETEHDPLALSIRVLSCFRFKPLLLSGSTHWRPLRSDP
jgi:hypothetical protein